MRNTAEHEWALDAKVDDYPVALVCLDATGQIQKMNEGWRELMGATQIKADLSTLVHPEDKIVWRDTLDRLISLNGSVVRVQLRFIHPYGELRWLDISCRWHAGAYYIAAFDATGQKRQESSIDASLRSALGLLNGVPGAIYRCRNNAFWTMENISDGCEQLTGYPPEWFLDRHQHSYVQLILPKDVDILRRNVHQALADRRPFEVCYRIRCADESIKNVWERGAGIYSANSEVLGIEGAIFSIDQAPRS